MPRSVPKISSNSRSCHVMSCPAPFPFLDYIIISCPVPFIPPKALTETTRFRLPPCHPPIPPDGHGRSSPSERTFPIPLRKPSGHFWAGRRTAGRPPFFPVKTNKRIRGRSNGKRTQKELHINNHARLPWHIYKKIGGIPY